MRNNYNYSENSGIKLYLDSIKDFNVLTYEEEVKYGNDLKLFDNITLLKRVVLDKDWMDILDLNKILLSCNDENYNEVISSLLNYFKTKETFKEQYNLLKKYDIESKKVNRALNKDELKNLFNIEGTDTLDSKDLLEEVKNYLIYRNAFDTFYNCNLKLVVHIAKDYMEANHDLLELVNEGNLGLHHAIQKFDIDKNIKFSTYASHWINNRILRFVISQKNVLSKSYDTNMKSLKFYQKLRELEQTLGHEPSIIEISKHLNIPIEKLNEFLIYNFEAKSFEDKIFEELLVGDTITSDTDIENDYIKKEEIEYLYSLLNKLNKNERVVIEQRYGIGTQIPKKLDEIGKYLGLTKQRVNVIEKKSLDKLKKLHNENKR